MATWTFLSAFSPCRDASAQEAGRATFELAGTAVSIEDVQRVESIYARLAGIDQWRLREVQYHVRQRLAGEIKGFLDAARESGQSVRGARRQLRESGLDAVLTDVRRQVADLACPQPQPGVCTTLGSAVPTDNETPVGVSALLVQLRWLLHLVESDLEQAAADWSFQTSEAEILTAIEDALLEVERTERRLRKLNLLVDEAPEWLLAEVGLEQGSPARRRVEELSHVGRDRLQDAQADAERLRGVVEELASGRQLAFAARATLNQASERVTAWYRTHLAAIQTSLRTWAESAVASVADSVSARMFRALPDDGRAIVAPRIVRIADVNDQGDRSQFVTVGLSVFRKHPTGNLGARPTGTLGGTFEDGEWQNRPWETLEEVPLGIYVDRVRVTDGQGRPTFALPGGSLRASTRIDRDTLAAALRHFGMPTVFGIGDAAVRIHGSFDSVEVRSRLAIEALPSIPELTVVFTGEGVSLRDPDQEVERQLERLRVSVEQRLATWEMGLPLGQANPPVRITGLTAPGPWTKDELRLGGTVRLAPPGLGSYEVPIEMRAIRDGGRIRWHTRADRVPDALVRDFRDLVTERLEQGLSALVPDSVAEAVSDAIDIYSHNFDLDRLQIDGEIVFTPPGDLAFLGRIAAPFSFGLRGTRLDVEQAVQSLVERLRPQADALRRMAERTAAQALTEAALDALDGASLSLAGFQAFIVRVERLDGDDETAQVDVRLDGIGDAPITLYDIELRAPDLQNGRVTGGSIDFHNARLHELETLIPDVLRIPDEFVTISQFRGSRRGIQFVVTVKIEALDLEAPLGQVCISFDGSREHKSGCGFQRAALNDVFNAALTQSIDRLAEVWTRDGDVLRDLRLDPDATVLLPAPGQQFVAALRANVKVWELPPLPVRVEVREGGSFRLEVELGLEDWLKENGLPLPLDPEFGQISARKISDSPLVIGVDGELVIADLFTLGFDGVELSRDRATLPATIRIRIPAPIPTPSGIWILRPGIGYSTTGSGGLEVLGDLALGEGLDRAIKVAATLGLTDLKTLRFDFRGTLIIVNTLPVMRIDGYVVLADGGRFEVQSKGITPFNKVFDFRSLARGQALPAPTVETESSVSVLGMELLRSALSFKPNGPRGIRIEYSGAADILLGRAEVGALFTEHIDDADVNGQISFSVGSFDIQKADLRVTAAGARLRLEALGLPVTVIAPGIDGLTPEYVLERILAFFDFDLDAVLDALLSGDVSITLGGGWGGGGEGIVGDGDAVGEGGSDGGSGGGGDYADDMNGVQGADGSEAGEYVDPRGEPVGTAAGGDARPLGENGGPSSVPKPAQVGNSVDGAVPGTPGGNESASFGQRVEPGNQEIYFVNDVTQRRAGPFLISDVVRQRMGQLLFAPMYMYSPPSDPYRRGYGISISGERLSISPFLRDAVPAPLFDAGSIAWGGESGADVAADLRGGSRRDLGLISILAGAVFEVVPPTPPDHMTTVRVAATPPGIEIRRFTANPTFGSPLASGSPTCAWNDSTPPNWTSQGYKVRVGSEGSASLLVVPRSPEGGLCWRPPYALVGPVAQTLWDSPPHPVLSALASLIRPRLVWASLNRRRYLVEDWAQNRYYAVDPSRVSSPLRLASDVLCPAGPSPIGGVASFGRLGPPDARLEPCVPLESDGLQSTLVDALLDDVDVGDERAWSEAFLGRDPQTGLTVLSLGANLDDNEWYAMIIVGETLSTDLGAANAVEQAGCVIRLPGADVARRFADWKDEGAVAGTVAPPTTVEARRFLLRSATFEFDQWSRWFRAHPLGMFASANQLATCGN